eukprot:TRINITY_DN18457_c0_g1_i1.p1 TRINITY_DN18457_c0_g1~~TRINITY_DN18457_c0_g1_i1.p1  ORF type:complete len:461 (-),score=96.31 TRINITY_DN18457_c0_g1_i1:242-1624(-)
MGAQCASLSPLPEIANEASDRGSDVRLKLEEVTAVAGEQMLTLSYHPPQVPIPAEVAIDPLKETSEIKDRVDADTVPEELALPPDGRLCVLMFGMTGAGKSSLGNCIAGENAFDVSDSLASVTNLDSVMRYEAADRSLILLDTIGLGDTELNQDKVVASIRDMALSATDGIDVLFFVMKNARLTDDAIARFIYVTQYLWGNECLPNLYVVVTGAPRYVASRSDGEAWIKNQMDNWRFTQIYDLVGRDSSRFIFVDNPDKESGEPMVAERQLASRKILLKTLVHHRRDVIPCWSSDRMRDAQERTRAERAEVERQAEEVRQARKVATKKKTPKQPARQPLREKPVEGVMPELDDKNSSAGDDTNAEHVLEEKIVGLKKAEAALSKAMQGVAADISQAAAEDVKLATSKFRKDYSSKPAGGDAASKPTGAVQACKRLISSLIPKSLRKKPTVSTTSAAAKAK